MNRINLEQLYRVAKPISDEAVKQIEYLAKNESWLRKSAALALEIRGHLLRMKMSQTELAARMEVTPAQVTKILSGKENLGLKTIAKIEDALGVALIPSPEIESACETSLVAEPEAEYAAGRKYKLSGMEIVQFAVLSDSSLAAARFTPLTDSYVSLDTAKSVAVCNVKANYVHEGRTVLCAELRCHFRLRRPEDLTHEIASELTRIGFGSLRGVILAKAAATPFASAILPLQ